MTAAYRPSGLLAPIVTPFDVAAPPLMRAQRPAAAGA